jgi:hypothetical protein
MRMLETVCDQGSQRRSSLLLSIFLIVLVAACTTPAPTPQTTSHYTHPTFPPEQLREDLDVLVRQLDSVHYDLYHAHPKATFDSLHHVLRAGLVKPLDAMGFYRHVLPLFGLVRDAHTLLAFPYDHVRSYAKQGGRFLPVQVDIHDGRVFVNRVLTADTLPPYAEIMSINGTPMREIVKELRALGNHERPWSEEEYMAFLLPRMLNAWYGFDSTHTLELRTPTEPKREVTLSGVPLDSLSLPARPLFSFRDVGESIGVLDIDRCEDKAHFAPFCDSVFTVLKVQHYTTLVIDLRDNGGGSTALGDTLITYLTERKFTQYPRVSIKYSRFQYPNVDSTHTITYDADISRAVLNPKLFTGELYVLVNEFISSSATVLAATVQCYDLGTLVGRETGGTQIFFDEPVLLQLPHTGQRILASHQFRWCPCGGRATEGVHPDVEVRWRYADRVNGVDAELEEVKRLERERRAGV